MTGLQQTGSALDRRLAGFLASGTVLEHVTLRNADGTPQRFKVTSVKTWRRSPERIEIGYKRGMYEFGVISQHELCQFTVTPYERYRLAMAVNGWHHWQYRSFANATTSSYSWSVGWINSAGDVRRIGKTHVYGPVSTHCATCGHARSEQVDRFNPYPKLCVCGEWY